MKDFNTTKWIIGLIILVMAVTAGWQAYTHRHYDVDIVLGSGVTSVARLSDYHAPLKNTMGDTNVFVLDGQKPGATMLVLGSTHSDEIAAQLAAMVLVENAQVEEGKLIVIPVLNNSGSRTTRPGEGQLLFYSIPTDWGTKMFRFGSRATAQADQWPDPEVTVHYPSRQMLADAESRNVNRCWPGKADGNLTQQIDYAVTQIMTAEGVDFAIDMHQGSTMFPVNNAIIAADSGIRIASYASALASRDDKFIRSVERSPALYRGLFNREIEETLESVVTFLMEVPIPFCDLPTGPKTEELLLTGQDPFLLKLAEMGRLYARYDEKGWPVDTTVGQHCSSLIRLAEAWSFYNSDKPMVLSGVPGFQEMAEKGLGYFFSDPTTNKDRVVKN